MELTGRGVIRVGMDLSSAIGANATFGNFRTLGASERVQAPGR